MKMLDAIDRGQPLTVYGDGSQAYDFVTWATAATPTWMRSRPTPSTASTTSARGAHDDQGAGRDPARGHGLRRRDHLRARGRHFVKNRIGSAELAEEELGFAATVGLEEGLRQLVHWRRGHLDELERRRERADATSV